MTRKILINTYIDGLFETKPTIRETFISSPIKFQIKTKHIKFLVGSLKQYRFTSFEIFNSNISTRKFEQKLSNLSFKVATELDLIKIGVNHIQSSCWWFVRFCFNENQLNSEIFAQIIIMSSSFMGSIFCIQQNYNSANAFGDCDIVTKIMIRLYCSDVRLCSRVQ